MYKYSLFILTVFCFSCTRSRYSPEIEEVLKLAAAMCPVRFMPLYELVKLYDAAGRKEDALQVAQQIMGKEIKIPSSTITAIKNKMRQWLEEQEGTDPAAESRTSDEPDKEKHRQGENPEDAYG